MQIKRYARGIFLQKVSIFPHFFWISAHLCAKNVVILQREIISTQKYEKHF